MNNTWKLTPKATNSARNSGHRRSAQLRFFAENCHLCALEQNNFLQNLLPTTTAKDSSVVSAFWFWVFCLLEFCPFTVTSMADRRETRNKLPKFIWCYIFKLSILKKILKKKSNEVWTLKSVCLWVTMFEHTCLHILDYGSSLSDSHPSRTEQKYLFQFCCFAACKPSISENAQFRNTFVGAYEPYRSGFFKTTRICRSCSVARSITIYF